MKKLLLSLMFLILASLFSLNAINAEAAITINSVSLIPNPVDPGVSTTGTISLTNTDAVNSITILLSSSTLTKGSDTITAPAINSIFLSANQTSTQTFTINVPSKPSGAYTATITATDSSNSVNSDNKPYTLNLNPKTVLDVTGLTDNKLTISGERDHATTKTFTIVNKGSTDLTIPSTDGIVITNTFTDNDDDKITFTLSDVPSLSMAPGTSAQVSLKASIDSNVDVGTYNGQVTVTATSSLGTQQKVFDLSAIVDPEICSDARVSDGKIINSNDEGFLRVSDINDPDSGDNFNPGEKIRVRGTVENHDSDNDLDVIVEATLYNIDRNKEIAKAESDSFNVDSDSDEDFDFELEVPSSDTNLKENDKYVMFIKVNEDGNEDENCNYDSVKLDFERKDHQVVINKATVTPTQVMCNANANFVVDVQNVGKKDEDRDTVELLDSELGLDYISDEFNLKKFDKSGDSQTVTYSYKIPNTAQEKQYTIEAIIRFNGGKTTDSQFITLNVKGCGENAGVGNVQISLLQGTVTASQGKLFGVPFKLSNLGSTTETYTIEVTPNTNWADNPPDQTITLQAGQETTLYSYLTPKADLSPGSYTLDMKVKQDNAVLTRQTATVQVGQVSTGGTPTGSTVFQPSVTFGSVWRNLANSPAFWIVAIIIVFALVVYILTILLRPR